MLQLSGLLHNYDNRPDTINEMQEYGLNRSSRMSVCI